MAEKKEYPEKTEKKNLKELRDLKPKNEVKGGVRKSSSTDKRSPSRTGEIDFMNWD